MNLEIPDLLFKNPTDGSPSIRSDEESVRDVLTRFFENEGFRVDKAAVGTAVLDMVAKAHFDVVVTDLRISSPNRLEVLKEIKQRTPKTAGRSIHCLSDV